MGILLFHRLVMQSALSKSINENLPVYFIPIVLWHLASESVGAQEAGAA